MRKSDVFVIIIVALVGTVAAFFICNAILGDPDERFETYRTINVIKPELSDPDASVFNVMAINPTVEVFVGNCEDVDQNGELDRAELVLCGRIKETGNDANTRSEDGVEAEFTYGWDDEEDYIYEDDWDYTEE